RGQRRSDQRDLSFWSGAVTKHQLVLPGGNIRCVSATGVAALRALRTACRGRPCGGGAKVFQA
ncbi:MAG: hypothetical protein ACK48R_01610, partial [Planctomyces sp.]